MPVAATPKASRICGAAEQSKQMTAEVRTARESQAFKAVPA